MAFGDIDGDGFTDFLSSSANSEGPNDEHDHEHDVYLVFGRPRTEIDSVYAVDTLGGADIVFYKGGFAMACADLDNDGYDDAILSESVFYTDPSMAGVYVVFGAPRDQLRSVYNFNPGRSDYTPPDMHIIGSPKLGGDVHDIINFGYDTVSRALVSGDLNGDGFADIVVGNHRACDPPGTCVDGAVYIIFGRARDMFPTTIDVDYRTGLPHPDVLILGDTNDRYPFNLALGDLDGDGVDDLLASASGWGENNTTPGLGEIHGWWGKRDWKTLYDTQVDDFDFALQGSPGIDGTGGYGLGYRMITGDLDGDGRDDLVVGSDRGYVAILPEDRRVMGEYRILFGRSRALWPKWGNAVNMTDVLILGANTGDALVDIALQWGICFSFATGNRDGDAFDDLLIGAGVSRRSDDTTRPGGAYWIRGKPRSQWEPLIDLRDGHDMIIHGVDGCDGVGNCGGTGFRAYDLLGFITAMGDIDGNGRDELFIAAPFADGPDNSIPDCGEIYVIYDDESSAPTSDSSRPPLARAALLPNYPNPFTTSTTFRIQAPRGETISLTVYDALGREVARPLAPTNTMGSEHEFVWSALDADGRALPSGVYFVKLRAGGESHARKVLLVR